MKQLLYTFSFIMLLLTTLLATWWHQSYEYDKVALRKQVERDLDDLLISNVFRKAVPFFMPKGPVWEGGTRLTRANRNQAYLDYSITSLRKNTRIILENGDNAPPEGLRSVTVLTDPFRRDSQSFTFHFQDDGFTLGSMPPEVLDTLRYRHKVGLHPLLLNELEEGSLANGPGMYVRTELINTGPQKDVSYFEVTDYRGPLLLGMLPEFLFGILLFGATGFAFATAYRNLFEQERQLRQKDALVANVAHELKTPIATVGVALEALNVFGADANPARRREYLAIGQAELQRLDQMADRAIESLQAGDLSQRLQPQRTDLTTAVHEAWRGLALRYNLPEDALVLTGYGDVHARVDPHYWHHLVYNLLDNACKYGGNPRRIEVMVSGQAHETVLTVTDNGPGIPRHEREKVFERFYRVFRPVEGHAVKGHGLGLTFVRQVAAAHGGSVEVDNAELGGARFTVKIPAL
jgi:signal transduction histidine kinase